MEKKIDIIPFLEGIVAKNTKSYQSDFAFDVERLTAAMLDPVPENRVFLWMSRPCGTWCVLEREAFLKSSDAFAIWTHPDYIAQADHIKAYRIFVEPGQPGSAVLGTVQPLNYAEQVERVKQQALPVDQVTVTFKSGEIRTMPFGDYLKQCHNLVCDSKTIEHIQYHAKDEGRLSGTLFLERHPLKERPRRPKKPPTR